MLFLMPVEKRNRISDGLHRFKDFLTVASGEALRVTVVIHVLLRVWCDSVRLQVHVPGFGFLILVSHDILCAQGP